MPGAVVGAACLPAGRTAASWGRPHSREMRSNAPAKLRVLRFSSSIDFTRVNLEEPLLRLLGLIPVGGPLSWTTPGDGRVPEKRLSRPPRP